MSWRCKWCRQTCAYGADGLCGLCRSQDPLFPTTQPDPSIDDIRLRDQQRQVLIGLLEMHHRFPQGGNAFELQAFLCKRGEDRGIERNAIGSRFGELAKMGLVEQSGSRHAPSGRPENVFVPTLLAIEWRKRNPVAA